MLPPIQTFPKPSLTKTIFLQIVMGEYCEYDNFSCDGPKCNEGPYSLNNPTVAESPYKTTDVDIPTS